MGAKEMVLDQLGSSQWLYENFTKDFSEADCRFQPFPGGNHLNWILCHLATTEDWVVGILSGADKKLAEPLHKAYGGGSTCSADDGMTRSEAWKIFTDQRARTASFLKSFDEARYSEPAPKGTPPMMPTIGSLIGLLGTHPFWHFGQLSVNRRLLKKPPVFGG